MNSILYLCSHQVLDYARSINDPMAFVGRCVEQVTKFVAEELQPAIEPYLKAEQGEKVKLDV